MPQRGMGVSWACRNEAWLGAARTTTTSSSSWIKLGIFGIEKPPSVGAGDGGEGLGISGIFGKEKPPNSGSAGAFGGGGLGAAGGGDDDGEPKEGNAKGEAAEALFLGFAAGAGGGGGEPPKEGNVNPPPDGGDGAGLAAFVFSAGALGSMNWARKQQGKSWAQRPDMRANSPRIGPSAAFRRKASSPPSLSSASWESDCHHSCRQAPQSMLCGKWQAAAAARIRCRRCSHGARSWMPQEAAQPTLPGSQASPTPR